MSDFDLDAYFARIGYGGPTEPTLETLTAIHGLQVSAIPFENLDPLLGRPVNLDMESLQAKLVRSRRGGYCFELNALFKAALEALGYAVTGLAGRPVWMAPPDAPLSSRTHMLLKVALPDGPYLADAGFGAQLLDAPLKLQADSEQSTPWADWRLSHAEAALSLAVRLPDGWQPTYIFTLEPQLPTDYEMGNWFTSTRPQSLFVNNLVAERLTDDRRYNLVNRKLTERARDGTAMVHTLTGAAELAEVLDKLFDIEPPAAAEAVFARLPAA
ncbi:MAG TPA: arylamine N-acetyltransferase, partial [Caulobacteraceae bacterium]|jgi:N-hydroxyarylamine O-acetyltransferase|nr:arylamine N-acetyltransferase [Caulobacteraceae bacterium]